MFDFTYLNILESNLINFIIMILIFCFIFKKLKVGTKLETKKIKIKEEVEKSEELKRVSYKNLEETKDKVKNIDKEIKEIKTKAEESVDLYKDTVSREIKSSIENLENNANKVIDNQKKRVILELSEDISEESVEKATENIKEILKRNPEIHQVIIDEFIENIDGLKIA